MVDGILGFRLAGVVLVSTVSHVTPDRLLLDSPSLLTFEVANGRQHHCAVSDSDQMVTLFSITLGLLIACIVCAVVYLRFVRESERLLWAERSAMHAANAEMWKRLSLKTLDRWQMLQGYPSLIDEMDSVDRTDEPAEDEEPASLLRLPDDELAERIREMNDPRSGMALDERRRIIRETKRRARQGVALPAQPPEEFVGGPVNELDMSQIQHLRN